MCVIIFVPQGEEITYEEFEAAWETNPHGAGFAIRTPKGIYYRRGFMDMMPFYLEVMKYMSHYDLMLHFRISTSDKINEVQTHPYDANRIASLEGWTKSPVISMNGIITGQKEYKVDGIDYNDTMSYILDNNILFNSISQQMIDAIEDESGTKWCVMTPKKVFISSKFTKRDGVYYSNENHMMLYQYYDYYSDNYETEYNIKDIIREETLDNIRKDRTLIQEINSFIHNKCSKLYCKYCTKCLNKCKTIRDIKISLKENK